MRGGSPFGGGKAIYKAKFLLAVANAFSMWLLYDSFFYQGA